MQFKSVFIKLTTNKVRVESCESEKQTLVLEASRLLFEPSFRTDRRWFQRVNQNMVFWVMVSFTLRSWQSKFLLEFEFIQFRRFVRVFSEEAQDLPHTQRMSWEKSRCELSFMVAKRENDLFAYCFLSKLWVFQTSAMNRFMSFASNLTFRLKLPLNNISGRAFIGNRRNLNSASCFIELCAVISVHRKQCLGLWVNVKAYRLDDWAHSSFCHFRLFRRFRSVRRILKSRGFQAHRSRSGCCIRL